MDEQTIFIIIFLVLFVSFYFGDDNFYGKYDSLTFMNNMDSFSCRLISLGLAAFLCAALWCFFITNYV
jgi:hypothetical protein